MEPRGGGAGGLIRHHGRPTATSNGPGGLSGPRFAAGRLLATPGALAACERAEVNPAHYLNRHLSGDWGDFDDEDKQANEKALDVGARLLSGYNLPADKRLWIITEWDRSVTTLLLPADY